MGFAKRRLLPVVIGFAFAVCGVARCSTTVSDGVDASDAHEEPDCPIPDAMSFSCEAGAPEQGGCTGFPGDCTTCDRDSGLSFPNGCVATLPEPTLYCHPQTCTCVGYWQCPH